MKRFILIFIITILFLSCVTTDGTNKVEKPTSDLYNTLKELTSKNPNLVISYTIGKIIEDYTYEMEMQSSNSFNAWLGFSIEELNCMVTVKMGDEIVAQIYSTEKDDKARLMANSFRGRKNVKVIHLNRPWEHILIEAYNNMMNGAE